jgi:hypothetical protein
VILVILAISVALNLALGVVVIARVATATPSFDKNAWYAVFINNLSVTQEAYVGHVTSMTTDEIDMQDIYYLTLEARDASGNVITNPKPEDVKQTLRKLGQEIYGPQDAIQIDRRSARYWIKLRADSAVVQAILRYRQTPGSAPAAPATSSPHP